MSGNEGKGLFHGDELDPSLRSALEALQSSSPDDSQLQLAMTRLQNLSPSFGSVTRTKSQGYKRRLALSIAASLTLCLLWLGAQTETWGQVAVDFQRSMAPEQAALNETGVNHDSAVPNGAPGPILRVVLMLHVFGLLSGLAGMLAMWVSSMWRWLSAIWCGAPKRQSLSAWRRGFHAAALAAYGVGIGFGCIWARSVWGGFWSWDPREASTLLILGIGVMWCASTWYVDGSFRQLTHGAFVASLSFWLIALICFLGNAYAAQLHSYGFPSRVPTAIIFLLVGNLLVLLGGHLWTRWRGNHTVTTQTR